MAENSKKNYLGEVKRHAAVMELQMHAIRNLLNETVDGIQQEITDISKMTEEGSEKAEALLERAYLEPESGQVELMDTVQGDVDDIFDQVQKGVIHHANAGQDRIRRLSGQFSKHMEAMSTLDSAIAGILVGVMGGLSRDDVIGQRLENLTKSIFLLRNALEEGLIQNEDSVSDWTVALKKEIYNCYTSEFERSLFKEIFQD